VEQPLRRWPDRGRSWTLQSPITPEDKHTDLTLDSFDALTFDCYGTLIDWESGLLAAYRRVLDANASPVSDDGLLEAHAHHESRVEAGPYLPYRQVLERTLEAVCEELGCSPRPHEAQTFGDSVGEWPAFPDSAAALTALATRFRLGVITNGDDDLFECSQRRLGARFDWVVTAEQARSYKPSPRNFELALERMGLPRERVLHVAQSIFHDHVPAKRLGLATVWIDRRQGQPGSGATPPASAEPDLTLPDVASLAHLAAAADASAAAGSGEARRAAGGAR